ncbi:hypothetical protein GUJ93_ZPchr0006g44051 [Zizania palustris]|uniref:Uncharacterized protein n=1 Tax=Zizania palustris TaxID=103762 RepID=A0A8J5T2S3_ZIZPA|nr:hypothetical protein GUJ93_ZPchr0006g44051 [Zizania palustris]
MGRYHHVDLAATAEEDILQAFALLHGTAIAIDREEGLTVEGIENRRRQASEATRLQQTEVDVEASRAKVAESYKVAEETEGIEGLTASNLVSEMGRYHHVDLAATTEEDILQAFALLHGIAIDIDREEGLTVEGIENHRRQASEATRLQQQTEVDAEASRAKVAESYKVASAASSAVDGLWKDLQASKDEAREVAAVASSEVEGLRRDLQPSNDEAVRFKVAAYSEVEGLRRDLQAWKDKAVIFKATTLQSLRSFEETSKLRRMRSRDLKQRLTNFAPSTKQQMLTLSSGATGHTPLHHRPHGAPPPTPSASTQALHGYAIGNELSRPTSHDSDGGHEASHSSATCPKALHPSTPGLAHLCLWQPAPSPSTTGK